MMQLLLPPLRRLPLLVFSLLLLLLTATTTATNTPQAHPGSINPIPM